MQGYKIIVKLFSLRGLFLLTTRQLDLSYTGKRNRTTPYSNIILNLILCTLSVQYEMVIDLQRGFFMFSYEIYVSSVVSTTSNSIMDSDEKPHSNGHVLRIEPHNVEWMSKLPLVVAKLKEAGWYTLCERIGDYHIEVMKYFCQNFKDSVVNDGGLEFSITNESISHAIGITPKGEK